MSTAITDGLYTNKLTYENFVEGLYVISYDNKIYITGMFIGVYIITNLATGETFHYEDGFYSPYGYRLFIIEDDSLIKILIKR